MLTALIPEQCVTASVYTLCYKMYKMCSASHHGPATRDPYILYPKNHEKTRV